MKKNIVFIGIAGVGLSALATLFKQAGFNVEGYDLRYSPIVDTLRKSGINVYLEQLPDSLPLSTTHLVVPDSLRASTSIYNLTASQNIPVLNKNEAMLLLAKETSTELILVIGDQSASLTAFLLAKCLNFAYCIGAKPNNEPNAVFASPLVWELDPNASIPKEIIPFVKHVVFTCPLEQDHWGYFKTPLKNLHEYFTQHNISSTTVEVIDDPCLPRFAAIKAAKEKFAIKKPQEKEIFKKDITFYAWSQPYHNAIHEIRTHPLSLANALRQIQVTKALTPAIVFKPYLPTYQLYSIELWIKLLSAFSKIYLLTPYPPFPDTEFQKLSKEIKHLNPNINQIPPITEYALFVGAEDMQTLIENRSTQVQPYQT